MNRFTYKEVKIASGASLSDEADLIGHQLVAIQMPTGWTTANLTFQARPGSAHDTKVHPNEVLQNVHNDAGTEVTVTAAASRYITLTGAVREALRGCGAIKVRSGTTAVPVNQGAERTLTLVLVPLESR